jgi:hypothetical protein
MLNDAHEDALIRQWTLEDGRKTSARIGSWVDLDEVLSKVESGETLTRIERRVLQAHIRRQTRKGRE